MIFNFIKDDIYNALKIMDVDDVEIQEFENPKNPDHGDISTNIAMQLAGRLKKAPRQIAQEIIDNSEFSDEYIEYVEIAGPGFINFKIRPAFYAKHLNDLIVSGFEPGRSNSGHGKKVDVEYVSVNPTGLLHLGHGRNAAIGDTIANLYKWTGHDVTREYYFNNAGNQMNNLARSIFARYVQMNGNESYPFPEYGYHGEYIIDIAKEFTDEHGDKYIGLADKKLNSEDLSVFRSFGEKWAFGKIKTTLSRMNISQDVFYNEDSLYSDGKIDEVITDFKEKGLAYEKDGALWLALTKMGLDDDRVIIKSTGEPTYRLPDIAYHREKFRRGFDIIVDIFGSDHIATIPDVLAGIKSLGYDPDKVKVIIHQFVTLTEDGKQVKMSKRSGRSYTLDDLLDEVGSDVVRFFLIMRGIKTHLEFDLNLAREQSEKNPVYYLQYAHARCCSVFVKAAEKAIIYNKNADISILNHKTEIDLIKLILDFSSVVENSCHKGEPQVLAEYLREIASAFHVFYHECRIIGEDDMLMQARLKLTDVTKNTMKNGLTILGISAPEKM